LNFKPYNYSTFDNKGRDSMSMFERFTERARQVVVLAQQEARTLKHNWIGTEHILLGLLREEEGLAARVLDSLDITVERVRAQVVRIVGSGDEITSGQIPFTPRADNILKSALREAVVLGHGYIGTEHILLALVRENEGCAARILLDFEADAEKVRNEVIRRLSGSAEPRQAPLPTPSPQQQLLADVEVGVGKTARALSALVGADITPDVVTLRSWRERFNAMVAWADAVLATSQAGADEEEPKL